MNKNCSIDLDKEQVGIIQIAKANLVNDPQNTVTHRRYVAKVDHKYLVSTQTLISIVRNLILQNQFILREILNDLNGPVWG